MKISPARILAREMPRLDKNNKQKEEIQPAAGMEKCNELGGEIMPEAVYYMPAKWSFPSFIYSVLVNGLYNVHGKSKHTLKIIVI